MFTAGQKVKWFELTPPLCVLEVFVTSDLLGGKVGLWDVAGS